MHQRKYEYAIGESGTTDSAFLEELQKEAYLVPAYIHLDFEGRETVACPGMVFSPR